MHDFDLTESRALLAAARKIVITTHVSPDGDAIGSSLALSLFLRKSGYTTTVITPDEYPVFLSWLPGQEVVRRFDTERKACEDAVAGADLIFCLDFNSPDRMAALRNLIESRDCPKILIDHHQNAVAWTTVLLSDPAASSTCELIYRFIEGLGGSDLLDSEIGSCLYTGIITDTGSFKFPSTTSGTLRIAASLMDLGVDTPGIQNLIYDNSSADRLRLTGYALTRKLRIIREYHTALLSLTADELKSHNYRSGDTEGLVNLPLGIEGIKMSVFVSEKKGEVRLSLRSKGNVPVHEIAGKYFRGGGHINAAGGVSNMSVEDTLKFIEVLLPAYGNILR